MAGLAGRENERISHLSGAWKQRLALGCAIVHRPKVLFLDEPTAGVDPVSRRQFWEMIYTLAGEGVTTFVTTHYMDEAERCNRVALMFDGKIIAEGEPDVLKTQMPGALVEVDAQPIVEAMDVLRQIPDVQEVIAKGLLAHAMLASSDTARLVPALTAALTARGIHVARIEPIEPSLEDVFISLIEVERRARVRAAFKTEVV
jgi:ABC-2 type transport system ATP-binding protein